MFSAKAILKTAAFAGSAIAATLSGMATAGVVIKSSGPSASQYPVGSKVDDNGRITLKAGDSVTVMSNGGTREIQGAGTHSVAQRGISKRSTFAALTNQRANSRVRTGAARTAGGVASLVRDNIWDVDVTQSGAVCVLDLSAVRMWRPGREAASTYVIASSNSADHLHVSFPENVMVANWDAERMPLVEGAPYTITGPSNGEPVSVSFVKMADEPADPEQMAAALIEKGCTSQLELLATKLM
ncbi:MAG: hypothetical protein WAT93_08950, partial [Pontixanthobacter sp.]